MNFKKRFFWKFVLFFGMGALALLTVLLQQENLITRQMIKKRYEALKKQTILNSVVSDLRTWEPIFSRGTSSKESSPTLLDFLKASTKKIDTHFQTLNSLDVESGEENTLFHSLRNEWIEKSLRIQSLQKFDSVEEINLAKINFLIEHLNELNREIAEGIHPIVLAESSFIERFINWILFGSLFLTLLSGLILVYDHKTMNKVLLALKKSQDEALRSSNLKSQFLATVSHEIRTPLNGIIALSDLLIKRQAEKPDPQFLHTISDSGRTLMRIVDDILEFSRFESGLVDIKYKNFDLKNLIDGILGGLNPKAEAKGIYLVSKFRQGLHVRVNGDKERLAQILFNIVGNAIKFTNTGGVILTVERIRDGGEDFKFTIQDTGIGMTPDQTAKIFQPFVQFEKSGTSGEPGCGLGLCISQKLVTALGGELKVFSKVQSGTEIGFEIPLRPTRARDAVPTTSNLKKINKIARQTETSDQGIGDLILVAEDVKSNQIVISAILKELGFQSVVAENGSEALSMVIQRGKSFAMILMDCQMPEMDGFEATKRIKKLGNHFIPVLAMTADVTAQNKIACMYSGMDEVIAKPISLEYMKARLDCYLGSENKATLPIALESLSEKIGRVATGKVLKFYLESLRDILSFENILDRYKDLTELARLGHKLKSSSYTVGAIELGKAFEKVESFDYFESALGFFNDDIRPLIYKTYREMNSLRLRTEKKTVNLSSYKNIEARAASDLRG
ncbi:MAG: response regulator [Bdellovibrionales bacterium]|nr:response regulator [Bdellovibrionales bacterium]